MGRPSDFPPLDIDKLVDDLAQHADLADSMAVATRLLTASIKKCRDAGWSWASIANATGIPAYCVRVIAGEIAGRRMTPENARSKRK